MLAMEWPMQSARQKKGSCASRRSRGWRREPLRYGPMREVLIATTNPGKLREIQQILRGVPVTLKTLKDFPTIQAPDETGSSFDENARQKAVYYAAVTGMLTMAEDSGFEVDALGGEPGIYSARYLREDATYDERFADIYRRVRENGRPDLSARFVCALAVVNGRRHSVRDTGHREGDAGGCAGRIEWLWVRSDLLLSAVRQDVR